jgi:hypothetical protein
VSSTRSVDFYVLIYVTSLVLRSPVALNIYNWCQDIHLISPVYFIHGERWHIAPDQEIDVDTIMQSRLEFDARKDMLDGILAYRIQRQYTDSDELICDESKSTQLLVAWHVEHKKGLHVRALLVEHDRELDQDKLRGLHQKCWDLLEKQVDPIGRNWLLNGATVLITTVCVRNVGYRWDIVIHDEVIENDIERPLWVNAER